MHDQNQLTHTAALTENLTPFHGYNVAVDDEYETNFGEVVESFRDAETADVGIIGVPFDTAAVAGPRGSRQGPNAIRDQLTVGTCYNPELDINIAEGIDIVDFGNVDVAQTEVPAAHDTVETVTTDLHAQGVTPFTLGGDHSLTYPAAKGLLNEVDSVGVINVDAHHDVRHSHGGELSSGTPFRRLLEDDSGALDGENFVELGLAGWHNSEYYVDWVRDIGGEIITAREVHRDGPQAAVERALDAATDGTDAVYLSVDIDVLEPADAPGTCVPTPGGLRSYQLLDIVHGIGSHELVAGADLMEVAPPLEAGSRITPMVAAAITTQFIGARKAALS